MIAIDAGFLALILNPNARPPLDPATKQPISQLTARLEKLEKDWALSRERILIPTPALSEVLVLAGDDAHLLVTELTNRSNFYVKPFDLMSAIEAAQMQRIATKTGSKRAPASANSPWQKVKVDRQIVAIAKVNQASVIYSDDEDVRNMAEDVGIKTISCWELDVPPSTTPLLENDAKPIDLK